jgi:hypothetical protein
MRIHLNLSVLALTIALAVTACGKTTTDPVVTPQAGGIPAEMLTRYTGTYVYTDATGRVETVPNATATLTDKGSNQIEVSFSPANAPRLTVTMQKKGTTGYASVDFSAAKGVSIDNKQLAVGVASTSPVYTLAFDGTR